MRKLRQTKKQLVILAMRQVLDRERLEVADYVERRSLTRCFNALKGNVQKVRKSRVQD